MLVLNSRGYIMNEVSKFMNMKAEEILFTLKDLFQQVHAIYRNFGGQDL